MNLDQLVTFRTVARMGSFRRAAEVLHLTQPAVSKQIRALELELGERLLERGRTVRLTHAGEVLLNYAERVSQMVQDAREEIGDLQELGRGRLSLGVSQSIAIHLLLPSSKSIRRGTLGSPSRRRRLSIDDLRDVPWVLNPDGCQYRGYLERRFAERGLTMNVAVEVTGMEVLKKLVQLGLGVTLLPKPLVAQEVKRGPSRPLR